MTLARDIDAYLKRTGMTHTALGRHAVNDSSFVGQFRAGAIRCGPYREARLRTWMQANPDGPSSPPVAPRRDRVGVPAGPKTTDAIGSAPFPPLHKVQSNNRDMGQAIEVEAKRLGKLVPAFLSELVELGWDTHQHRTKAQAG